MFFQKQPFEDSGEYVLLCKDTGEARMLILASSSLGRQQILNDLGLRFQVDPADIDERSIDVSPVTELVSALAFMKAKHVLQRHSEGIILAADTMLECDGEVIGKPKDAEDAERILTKLSNKTHQIITGFALMDVASGAIKRRTATTRITFRELSKKAVTEYILTGEPFGKAGAYALQGRGADLVESIQGEPSNVCGLPKQALLAAFSDLGLTIEKATDSRSCALVKK